MTKRGNVVLVIEQEAQIRRFLRVGFKRHGGFFLKEAKTAAEGLKAATFNAPDLIILDLALPDLSGSLVLEQIRSWSDVPIIVLSVESDEIEKVLLFELGADDYVVKPFGIAELIARSKAALRRYYKGPTANAVVEAGPLSVDIVARTVSLNNKPIQLTPQQFHLLRVLAANVGFSVTHDQLIKAIWRCEHRRYIPSLRILVREIRELIEIDPGRPRLLATEWGVGYRLQSPS
jgi:two-component system, OmpR family, KDP operon response regulator KdpE